jgi:Copper amine oxidase, N3 domain
MDRRPANGARSRRRAVATRKDTRSPRRFGGTHADLVAGEEGRSGAVPGERDIWRRRTIKKDPRVVEALKKRGLTDLNTVRCTALPLAYAAIPEQDTQRIGFGGCSQQHGFYHGWGRSIDGLTLQMDMVTKKVLKVMSRVGFDDATARW